MPSLLLLFLLPFLLLAPTWTLEFRYHNNSQIEQYLLQVSTSNPDITHMYSIGKSVRGKEAPALCSELVIIVVVIVFVFLRALTLFYSLIIILCNYLCGCLDIRCLLNSKKVLRLNVGAQSVWVCMFCPYCSRCSGFLPGRNCLEDIMLIRTRQSRF